MSSTRFQWDKGNRQHVIDAYPKRENSQNEVESLFDDSYLRSMPDLVHSQDEVRYSTLLFLLTDNQKVTLLTNLTESKLSHVKALAGF